MINWIIEFSAAHRALIVILAVALVLGGLWSMHQLPIDAIPDLSDPPGSPDAPGEAGRRRAELYGMLLRANHATLGPRFSIGPDGDLYLVGRLLLEHLDVVALDRVLGELYALTERWFSAALTLFRRGRTPPL